MNATSRYHPLLAALHWTLAVLIIAALMVGYFALAPTPNADAQKIGVLRLHMVVGMLILALMAIRFVVRLRTARPSIATTGYPLLDRIALIAHSGFYVLVLLMAGTGLATAILAGLNRIVFQGTGEPLPASFSIYPTFIAHSYLAALLAALIALHVLAACYHQFVKRDGALRRMSFGGGSEA